ncbi:hypothetical protein [Myceligenerans crystallogenes]|uniref:Uncharacterized protein n=1 Tax=Myceligenerans crystallogenes TaxID=316335 RepID=A0ABN2N949_9MICO
MIETSNDLPVSGLQDLSNESRMIVAPWSRLIRGIGLGQYVIDFDPAIAGHVRTTFDQLSGKLGGAQPYADFCRQLAEFTLLVADPAHAVNQAEILRSVGPLLDAARAEPNPYFRAMAGSLVMDTFAKLGVDRSLLVDGTLDFPAEVLAVLDEIAPDGIADENRGRHGDYERLSASSTVFLAIGQLGLRERLVTPERNHVVEGLDLLENIPAPYFRGRAGSMFLSVVTLLGYDEYIFDGDRDYMRETLEYMARADEIGIFPAFPQAIPTEWKKAYPLLTMLNAIAMSGRAEYLRTPVDWLAEARTLLDAVPWEDRVHMSQYYVTALHNLGRLGDELPDLDSYMDEVVAVLDLVDPGANFFPSGIAYPYIVELAMLTGRMHLIPAAALERMADALGDLDHGIDRANNAFPVSYVLNVLGEIGRPDLIFQPRERYDGRSAIAWVIDNISEAGEEERLRLYMIPHALLSYALRMRGSEARETELFENFRFGLAAR